MLDRDRFLMLLKLVKERNAEKVFDLVYEIYGDVVAVQAVDALLLSHQHVVNELAITSNLTSNSFTGNREVFFVIPLLEAPQYCIGCTVEQSDFQLQVWFHHYDTDEKFKNAELCVSWSNLSPQDHAMWSLLISKIERLEFSYFERMFKSSIHSTLIDERGTDHGEDN